MTNKVRPEVFSTENNLEWRLTKKVDGSTGKPIDGSSDKLPEKQLQRSQLQGLVDKSKPAVEPKVAEKPVAPDMQRMPEAAAKTSQSEAYLGVKEKAGQLNAMSQGIVKQPDSKQPQSDTKDAYINARQANQPDIATPVQKSHQVAATFANLQAGKVQEPKSGQPVETPKVLQEGVKTAQKDAVKQPKNGNETNHTEQAVSQAGQAGQAGAAMAGQKAEKSTQLNRKDADNDNREEKSEKSVSKGSPRAHGAAASRGLSDISAGNGGLGSSTTTTSGGIEITADGIPETVTGKNLGIEMYNAEDADMRVKLAAVEYEGVEKILKPYVSIDKKVENFSDKELAKRIVAETKKELAAAQLLIEQLRSTKGRGSASGHGMAA